MMVGWSDQQVGLVIGVVFPPGAVATLAPVSRLEEGLGTKRFVMQHLLGCYVKVMSQNNS